MRVFSALSLMVAGLLTLTSCAPVDPHESDDEHDEHVEEADAPVSNGTVEDAMNSSCSTMSIKPLSQQILDEMACMAPGKFVSVPARPNLVLEPTVFPYLVASARDNLVAALDANPNRTMNVASMFRTVGQQYILRRWYEKGRCGIKAAAKPGNSNHETGLAIDIGAASTWKTALQSRGFSWLGSKDPPHFDYRGSGATDFRGLDVEAFQRLWNRNNPSDKIAEDGDWGPQTMARMKKSPAKGFAIGAGCTDS